MKYPSGEDVRIWDRVRGSNWRGIVVFSIDAHDYSTRFPEEQWAYLGQGAMLDTTDAGLVHHPEADDDLELDHRGDAPTPEEWAALRREQVGRQAEWRAGSGFSVQISWVNPHGQICLGHRGVPGTDHMQFAYRVECGHCGHVYGANGSDMHERRCPKCQSGAAGIPY